MSETTPTQYPFPDGEDNILKQKFNIDLRVYSTEQKDAAAAAWVDFCRNQVDSSMFIKLIALCDGSLTEATVLWDLLKFHRTTGNKLKGWREISVQFYVDKYGKDFGSARSFNNSLLSLWEAGLIIQWPLSGNVPKKFRIDWIDFYEKLGKVSNDLPGLNPLQEVVL
jgi:hypothetical protein